MELDSSFMNIIARIAMLVGLAFAGWWIWTLYYPHSREVEKELPEFRLPANLREVAAGIPAPLIFLYIIFAIMMIAYVLYVWLGGVTY